MSLLAPTLQAFFTDRLINQRKASPHTIAAYRDTLRMLLGPPRSHGYSKAAGTLCASATSPGKHARSWTSSTAKGSSSSTTTRTARPTSRSTEPSNAPRRRLGATDKHPRRSTDIS
jgi:hypothetical protein